MNNLKTFKKHVYSSLILILSCLFLSGCAPISGYSSWRQDPDNWNDYATYNKIVNGVPYTTTENESDASDTADLISDDPVANHSDASNSGESLSTGCDVYFLDVGQGACTLFVFDNSVLIIDGGDRDTSSYVVSYLQKTLSLPKIDAMIATHYDSDHISGLIGCLTAYKGYIGTVFDPHVESDTQTYKSYIGAVDQSGAQRIHPQAGDKYSIDSAIIEFIGPVSYTYDDDNNNSLVTKFIYGDTSFLIPGDAELDSINDMLRSDFKADLDSDVYLFSHHGSAGAFSSDFLGAISPSYTVIQCGRNNSYGHPHKEIMQYLHDTGIPFYRTDLQNEIVCHSDGKNITFDLNPSTDYRNGTALSE